MDFPNLRERLAAIAGREMQDQSPARTELDRAPAGAGETEARPLGQPDDHPLELILARNLVSIISLAAMIVDADQRIVFYNEAAADIVGSPFEEIGTMPQEEWNARYGPFNEDGAPVPPDELPLGIAVRDGRPAYARLLIRGESGPLEVETGALPLVGPTGYHGAIVIFWVIDGDGAGPR
jgi:PAS domain-containing protein